MFEILLSILLSVDSEVELLALMVIVCLIFVGTAILFSTAASPFYISVSSAPGFQFLQIGGRYYSCFSITEGEERCREVKWGHIASMYRSEFEPYSPTQNL